MDQESDTDDRITDAFLSGSPYERLRIKRQTYFSQPIDRKLAVMSLLLAGLASLLPMYALFPAAVARYLPAADPTMASPKVVILGLIGAGIETFAAVLLVGAAVYRIRNHPLSRTQARTALNVEDFASYLGFGTGGLTITVTVAFFLLGVAGETAMESYVRTMDGINPFAASGVGLSVAELATYAFVGSVTLYTCRAYLRLRLLELDDA